MNGESVFQIFSDKRSNSLIAKNDGKEVTLLAKDKKEDYQYQCIDDITRSGRVLMHYFSFLQLTINNFR